MPKKPEFRYRKDNRGRWLVEIPASLSATGKRQRAFHPNRDKARDACEKMRAEFLERGNCAAGIVPSLAEDAVKAAEILAPWKLSLTDAARLVAEIKERESASETVKASLAAFLLACEGLRDRTLASYQQTTKRLESALGKRLLATLTPEEIAKAGWSNSAGASAAVHYRNARAWWNWSAKKGWCKPDTFTAIEPPRVATDGEIEILTPREARTLMRTAERRYPEGVAHFALALYGGIRMEELTKLEEKHVSPEGIDIPASVAKKGRRRHIAPSATLAAWLERYPFKPLSSWPRVNQATRRLAGWQVESQLLTNPPPATRGPWPQNALRHSHASYAVAAGMPLERLLFEFGHSGTPAVLRGHYVGRASKRDALEFFALRPRGKKAKAAQIQPVQEPAA